MVAQYLRNARWAYAAVNGLHIMGIALLVGAIVPFNLKLLGLWPRIDRHDLAKVLVPTAATGLCLAIAMGLLLFATRASEYAGVSFFQVKIALVLFGLTAALVLHIRHGFLLESASAAKLRAHAMVSLACWTLALACGRLIAFV